MSHFSQMLRRLRKDAGITQEQLAKEVGVSKSSINMYERGEREPNYKTLEKISRFFNLPIDYLLTENFNIDQALNASLAARKALRNTALKFNLISITEYKNLSDEDIRKMLINAFNDDTLSQDEIHKLSTEITLILFSLTESTKHFSTDWKDFNDRIKKDLNGTLL